MTIKSLALAAAFILAATGAASAKEEPVSFAEDIHPILQIRCAVCHQKGAEGYEKSAGKQWTQQLGASLSVFDAGFAALKAAGDPTDKAAVAKAIASLNTTTIAGKVDFTSGPVPNVASGPIIGTQWVKAPAGSKFKLDYVVTDHVTDPSVPIGAKLIPYNG